MLENIVFNVVMIMLSVVLGIIVGFKLGTYSMLLMLEQRYPDIADQLKERMLEK